MDAEADPIVTRIVERVEPRVQEIGARLAERYREDILEYRLLADRAFANDILTMATSNLEELLADLRSGTPVLEERLERFRESGIRRAHQGVSIHALLHAYRLWGQLAWEEILAVTDVGDRDECAAALSLAGSVMAHVDRVSTAVAAAYLDEVAGVWNDREVLRRDLLERLIAGRADSELARRQAAALKLDVDADHVVVLLRSAGAGAVERAALRATLELAKRTLRPQHRALLVGLREDEIVAIYPVANPVDLQVVDRQAQELAAAVDGFVVGLGRRHPGLAGIARSYAESQEALEIALASGTAGRAVGFANVLLDHIVRSSSHSEALLEDVLTPLREYDERRRASLLPTLRAYFENGFSLTHSANALHVHPNTVVYRLRRVHELTGRDPNDPNDLLLLVLGLKLGELRGGADAGAA